MQLFIYFISHKRDINSFYNDRSYNTGIKYFSCVTLAKLCVCNNKWISLKKTLHNSRIKDHYHYKIAYACEINWLFQYITRDEKDKPGFCEAVMIDWASEEKLSGTRSRGAWSYLNVKRHFSSNKPCRFAAFLRWISSNYPYYPVITVMPHKYHRVLY